MPNPWTGKGNPYTREEVRERFRATLAQKKAIIGAGAGTGISAKFIEKGGADFLIIYNSGRFRMSGHGSTAGLMAYGDANQVAMEIGEFEVLPVVEEIPVFCPVDAASMGFTWKTARGNELHLSYAHQSGRNYGGPSALFPGARESVQPYVNSLNMAWSRKL